MKISGLIPLSLIFLPALVEQLVRRFEAPATGCMVKPLASGWEAQDLCGLVVLHLQNSYMPQFPISQEKVSLHYIKKVQVLYDSLLLCNPYKPTQTQNISKSLQTSPRHLWAIDVERHSHLLHGFLSMESANRVEWVRGFFRPNVKNSTYFHDTIAII